MERLDTPARAGFRREVRAWLEAHLPSGWGTSAYRMPETAVERVAFAKAWQLELFEGGWAGLDWPREYGGRALGPLEQLIFLEEYARADAPGLVELSVGPSLVGPTLIAAGSDAQRSRFLEPILRGDEVWCQGFSEPGAGSDLASLATRGEVGEDAVVVTGQKIWTSFAQHAQWCILVVRTDPEAARHAGLSFLLVDMRSPGITLQPLVEMTGEAWFNQVFFDRVRVPLENVVGTVGGGWDIVITTLSHERGSSAAHASMERALERIARAAPPAPGLPPPLRRQRLAQHAIEARALQALAYRHAAALERTGRPGTEGSIMKLAWSEADQRLKRTAAELLGPYALLPRGEARAVDAGHWAHELLWSRAATIYAGTSEVQRNIIAERVLGLPRR